MAWLAGSFFGYPLEKESTSSACGALAASIYDHTASKDRSPIREIAAGAAGPLLEAKMQNDYPNVPPAMTCAAIWWAGFLSPSGGNQQ